MNPVLARLALKFIVSVPALLRQFSLAVQDYKRLAPTDADLQALPSDREAIEGFARATQAALQENADITARLRDRAAREAEDDGA